MGKVGGVGATHLLIHLFRRKSHRLSPHSGRILSPAFPFLDLGVRSGGKHLLLLTPWEKNTIDVRNVMEVSKIHRMGYTINGEIYVLLCSGTRKTRKFLEEEVETTDESGGEGLPGSHERLSQVWGRSPSLPTSI